MAQSDITIDALSKVGQQDAEYLVWWTTIHGMRYQIYMSL